MSGSLYRTFYGLNKKPGDCSDCHEVRVSSLHLSKSIDELTEVFIDDVPGQGVFKDKVAGQEVLIPK